MANTDELIANHTFDELAVGQQAQLVRTLTAADLQAFALVSGDMLLPPGDADTPPQARFPGRVGQGIGAAALISHLVGSSFPGAGSVCTEQHLRYLAPVEVGDVLTVALAVVSKNAELHQVLLDCAVSNQRAESVVSGQAVVQAPPRKIVRPHAALPTLHVFDPEARLSAWVDSVAQRIAAAGAVRCAVVHPCDDGSLRGALDAAARGLIVPVLVAPEAKLRAVAASAGLSLDGVQIEPVEHSHAAAERAVAMAAAGQVQMLMKGSLHTDELMKAVLAEPRLRTGRRVSHVFRFEVPAYPRPLLVTDAAINIAPTLADKADIVRNVVDLAHALGIACPKVAILSAVETVTPAIASTLDAAALCKMADRGQITGAVLDGPLAFDNAISAEAARIKGIQSPVSGLADVLVVPDLEAGNMLAKQLEYLAGASSCGVVLGARVPIALTSRADGATARVASAALAALGALPRPQGKA